MKINQSILKIGTALFLFLCICTAARAQRTAYKSVHIGISPKVSCYSIPSGGIELNAGQYLLNSYWTAGVSATDWNQKITSANGMQSSEYFDHIMWNINGGWLYRILGTYSRWLSIYAGAKAFIGGNNYEVLKDIPEELHYDLPKMEFIYGIEPVLDIEVYISNVLAFTVGVQAPLTFGSTLESDFFRLTGSLGIRINI